MVRIRPLERREERRRLRLHALYSRIEKMRKHRSLDVDSKNERRASHADDDHIESDDDSEPEMDLKQHSACANSLRRVEECLHDRDAAQCLRMRSATIRLY